MQNILKNHIFAAIISFFTVGAQSPDAYALLILTPSPIMTPQGGSGGGDAVPCPQDCITAREAKDMGRVS